MKNKEIYSFENFRLDAEKHILWHRDEVVPLKPKALETLIALVQWQVNLATKNELMEEIWTDSFVGDNNLSC